MRPSGLYAPLLLSSLAWAQAPDILFTTTRPEQTLSGSGGTILHATHPNEVLRLLPGPGPATAEKWAPRTMFHVHAGDDDADDRYWQPGMFQQIDALLSDTFGTGPTNQRKLFFSPAVPMATAVSGGPGLRPGDVGRIRKLGGLDGQVEHFITAEQIQLALGLPPVPAFVNVDAFAAQPNLGVMFSIETDTPVMLAMGPPTVLDGDVMLIPPAALAYSGTGTIAAVLPGSAVVAYREAQLDNAVTNAVVTDRDGICLNTIIDADALEIDLMLPIAFTVPSMFGPVAVPHVIFAGESLTGGGVLDTFMGGRIRPHPSGQLGNNCGVGPTFGSQVGLLPPSAGSPGIASSVNSLATAQVCTFVTETPTPQVPMGTPTQVDYQSPGTPSIMLLSFAPGGPGAVPLSATPGFPGNCYPNYYPGTGAGPFSLGWSFAGPGFGSWAIPPIPFPGDLLFQMVTFTSTGLELSTPTIIEVF